MFGRTAKTSVTTWASKRSQNSEQDLVRHHIFVALQRAMMARTMLEVRVQGDERVYQSLILELDSDEGTVLIDELFPGTYEGVPGQKMDICLRQKGGRSLRFAATILQRHSYDGAPIYVINMPEDLNQDQRRASFRLPIDTEIMVESHFVGPDHCHYTGQLRNLSSGGLCLATDQDDRIALAYDDVLKDLIFEYEGVQVECEAKVKNIITDIETRNPTQVGVQFQQMSTSEHRQLEQLILKMQRQYLRNRDDQLESFVH